jgi:hypothetical protein
MDVAELVGHGLPQGEDMLHVGACAGDGGESESVEAFSQVCRGGFGGDAHALMLPDSARERCGQPWRGRRSSGSRQHRRRATALASDMNRPAELRELFLDLEESCFERRAAVRA